MKQDMTKTVSFGNTFRYIGDLFSVNNEGFGDYISAVYPSELELKETSMASNEVCYLNTRIKHEDDETPYHISVYDKRDDFNFQIVNFPNMDNNIPSNRSYGVYISQLVRYARICASKVDFIHRLHQLSSRLQRQGFKYALLLKSLTKFFNRHGANKKHRRLLYYMLLIIIVIIIIFVMFSLVRCKCARTSLHYICSARAVFI